MNNYTVNYSISTDSRHIEEIIRCESEAQARKIITDRYPGKIVHIWTVRRG